MQQQQQPPAGPHISPPNPRSFEEKAAKSNNLQDRAVTQERRAPWELVQLSTPANLPSNGNYAYDDSAGDGSTIYVFDSGLKTLLNVDQSHLLTVSANKILARCYPSLTKGRMAIPSRISRG